MKWNVHKFTGTASLAAMLLSASLAQAEVKDYKNYRTEDENVPVVYFTKDISPEGLLKVYKAMG